MNRVRGMAGTRITSTNNIAFCDSPCHHTNSKSLLVTHTEWTVVDVKKCMIDMGCIHILPRFDKEKSP